MSQDYRKGPVCGVDNCRETRYRVLEDGYTYCRNGHRAAIGVAIEEAGDFLEQRSARRVTRKAREAPERLARHLEGAEAYEMYLQCYQLVLRKQVHWLVRTMRYPAELEVVVRDLWTLQLTTVKERAKPGGREEEEQLYSSQAETDDEGGGGGGAARILRGGGRRYKGYLKLSDTIAICYLGFLLLRLPVSVAQFHEWIETQQFLFLKAFHAIPLHMTDKLPPSLRMVLHQRSLPSKGQLHVIVADVASNFRVNFGMELPPINHVLYLFDYITKIAIPLEVFPAVNRLASLLSYDFIFPAKTHRTPIQLHNLAELPEPSLAALLVVAVKLFYPFDSVARHPRTNAEPFARGIDWEKWNKTTKDFKDKSHRAHEKTSLTEILNLTEEDVFKMSSAQLDDYLEWYDQTWTSTEVSEKTSDAEVAFQRDLFAMFPTGRTEKADASGIGLRTGRSDDSKLALEKLKIAQRSLVARRVVPEPDDGANTRPVNRPGSRYSRYRTEEEVPEMAKPFFETVAQAVGLTVEDLVAVVSAMEDRLQKLVDFEAPKIPARPGRPRRIVKDGGQLKSRS